MSAAAHGSDGNQVADLRRQVEALTAALANAAPQERGAELLVSDLARRYLAALARETWVRNVRDLLKAPLEYFGPMRVRDIGRSSWVLYRDEVRLKQTTRFGRPPSPRTLNLELRRLKSLFNWAVEEEILSGNPLQKAKTMRASKGRQTEISPAGIEAVLSKSDSVGRAFWLLALDCGMRFNEIRTLTWRQVDLDRARIRIYWRAAKNKHQRVVPVTERALEALRDLRKGPTDAVFGNPASGLPWSRTTFWERIRRDVDQAGLQADPGDGRVHFHDARHTWMSQALRSGVRLPVVMKISGHLSLAAAQTYIHVNDDDLQGAKDILDGSGGRS
jgi:integrase